MRLTLLLLFTFASAALAARPCLGPDETLDHPDKEVCVAAHVYDVVESSDGTRYLDVCKPDLPDASCHFTVVSLAADRKEVGDLEGYREQEIHIRGIVHLVHGQSMIILSHARQFKDGAEKFRPNPALLAGFSSENGHTAFKDPALSAHHRKASTAFSGKAH